MSKHVYKYGTGQEIPKRAKYLYSREQRVTDAVTDGILVWHYFLVEVTDE